jgi:type IV pilus assembly protein PilQ
MREMKLSGIAWKALKKAVLLSVVTLVMPGMAAAAQINGVSLMDSDGGDVLRVEADAALEYQVFDLDGPPRMVINFPAASISSDITAIRPGGEGVISVFPARGTDGVRLEIGLSEMIGYKIEESGNALVVRFEKTGSESTEATTAAAVIKDIEVRDRGGVTELILRGDNMDASHNAFLSNDNQTLILDFWEGKSKLPRENYKFSTQRISDVTIGKAEGRVRLVIGVIPGGELSQQIDAEKGKLTVRIGSVAPKRRTSVVVVESVDFRPDDRIAHLMIRTDAVNPILNITEKDGNVIIDVKKAALAKGQERTQDVSAFPGPVKQIDSYAVGQKVRIVVRLRDKVDITSFQHGNVFTINLEPEDIYLARVGSEEGDEFVYSGQKVTFDFKDIDIRNALKLISEMSDLNIIMSDDVSGMLTMRLVDVPWDQALDLILTARGLGQEKTGNVMRIAPVEVLRMEYESKLKARKGSQQLELLVTEFITLSFTKVADVKKMLEGASANATKGAAKVPAAGAAGGETSVGILSPRGSFLVDERTNTLIVKDTQSAINSVKRLIATIDKPVRQVLIESRIVEANDNFTRDIGIRWGGQYNTNTGNRFPDLVAVGPAGTGTPIGNSSTLVDLPAAVGPGSGGAIGLTLASLGGGLNLDLELSAAEIDDEIKIISNPRVVTTNLKPAFIKQGTKVGIVTPGSANNPPSTVLVDALLELTVTPQITANDGVIMDIVVTKNTPTIFNNETGIDSKEISTSVYMKNGETVVIGGIYTRDKTQNIAAVPGLSKIPVLGWLFKAKKNIDNKTELLIFITPKILDTGDQSGADIPG